MQPKGGPAAVCHVAAGLDRAELAGFAVAIGLRDLFFFRLW